MARPVTTALVLAFGVAGCALVSAQSDRAAVVLAEAREAIGGQPRLAAVASLSLTGAFITVGHGSTTTVTSVTRRGDEQSRWNLEVSVLLPDKFVIKRSSPINYSERYSGLNGDGLISEQVSAGGWQPTRFIGPGALPSAVARQHREFARWMLAWLLMAPEQFHARFADAGETDTNDGRADVVEVKGDHDFAVRLFIDKQTHHPLMLVYREPPRRGAPAIALPKQEPNAAAAQEPLFNNLGAAPGSTETVVRLAGYRADDGILFPHEITVEIGGQTFEIWQISRFRVNPRVDPKRFEPKFRYPLPPGK